MYGACILISYIFPGDVVKHESIKCIIGEGMPIYRDPFEKGRLIIQFQVKFPPNKYFTSKAIESLEKVLPPREVSTYCNFLSPI